MKKSKSKMARERSSGKAAKPAAGRGLKKFSVAEIEAALRAGAGVISQAALKLGCARQTVHNYMKANEDELAPILEDIRGNRLDIAITHHLNGLKEGDSKCIDREMNTIAAGEMGYGRHAVRTIRVVGVDGGPIQVQHSFVEELLGRIGGIASRLEKKEDLQGSDGAGRRGTKV